MQTPHVSGREYVLQDNEIIVSKTDPYGNITYVNQDFLRICGYSQQELIGAPQNIIRHPDMPREAFYDLWHTIKQGKAWSGMVKNRCKNGDHYWVEAHVSPIVKDGELIGYTSIRVKPSRQQVQAADRAYSEIRGGSRRITIREGAIVRRPRLARHPQHAPFELSLKAKLGIWCAGLFILFLACLLVAWGPDTLMWAGVALDRATAMTVLVVTGMLVILAGGVALFHALLVPLRHAQQAIDIMCSGDLSARIDAIGNNEISRLMQSLRKLQINVKLLIGQIRESTIAVEDHMARLVDGNTQLAARTRAQTDRVAETSAYMAEITAATRQYAENAGAAKQLVDATSQATARGTRAVSQVHETMRAIQESAKQIEDISSLIDGIAFQTNILALNAAVEASHAGDHGRGFSVVAAEVRQLPLRSADAANEIKTLSQDTISRVNEGSDQTAEAASIIHDIHSFAQKAADFMEDIARAGQEQSAGIEHINQALTQIEHITQENRDQVVGATDATDDAYQQSYALTAQVDEFRLIGTDA